MGTKQQVNFDDMTPDQVLDVAVDALTQLNDFQYQELVERLNVELAALDRAELKAHMENLKGQG